MKTKASITALCAILLCSVLILFGNTPQNTPTRIGEFVAFASYSFEIDSIEKLIEESDVVAEVEIKEWLGEDHDINYTFFKAKVAKIYNNKTKKKFSTIKLMQGGDSKRTY